MSTTEKAAKSVFIIMCLTLAGKILGFIREALIAAKFGSTGETDAFFIAMTATAFFTTMVTTAIQTTIIPILSEVKIKEGQKKINTYTNNLLNIIATISFAIIILGWFSAPLIMRILAHGFQGEQFELAVVLLRIGLPVVLISGVVGVFGGYLQIHSRFTESALANLPINFVYIFFLLFFTDKFGIKGLMVASIVAVGTQILVQIFILKKLNFAYRFIIDIRNKYVMKVVYLVPPVLMSVAIDDLNKIVDRSLASTLINGSVSALNYANRLNKLIDGIFIVAFTTVIFPILSKEANKINYDNFKKVLRYGINIILLISIPSTIVIIVLNEPIVRLVFQRGAFDANATYMTAGALVFYSLGLPAIGLRTFMNKAYYALQDTKTPMINGFIAVGVNIILNFLLIKLMGHRGLALASSIAATVTTILLIYGIGKKIGNFEAIKIITCGLKSLTASIVMGVFVYNVYFGLEHLVFGNTIRSFGLLVLSCIVGLVIYIAGIFALKLEEINWFIQLIKQKITKKTNISND